MSSQANDSTKGHSAPDNPTPNIDSLALTLHEVPKLCLPPANRPVAEPSSSVSSTETSTPDMPPSKPLGWLHSMELGLLPLPPGTELTSKNRRRVASNEASLTFHVLHLHEDISRNHHAMQDQHEFITNIIANLQSEVQQLHSSRPHNDSIPNSGFTELTNVFNQSMDTMEQLTLAVTDSLSALTGIHNRLGTIESHLDQAPVQHVITPAAKRSIHNGTQPSVKRGRGAGSQYLTSQHTLLPATTTSVSENTGDYGVSYVRFLTTAEPGGILAACNILSLLTQYAPGNITAAYGKPASCMVFLHFCHASAANVFVQIITAGLNGAYADSSATIVSSLPLDVVQLGN
ncbi:hypothetical protein ARMGADRAFT_1031225 [Armillaria gallica]|uniref:Uncharacterized protein n=1 Tax=Armillaria gallica TaxID=47427 RepID=A0A2H3DE11_ARMGA|nr:hypothetical protein ARMGADRAFT_1031225 [Armillaria gallica]